MFYTQKIYLQNLDNANCYIECLNFSFLRCKYSRIFMLWQILTFLTRKDFVTFVFNEVFTQVKEIKFIIFVDRCFIPSFTYISATRRFTPLSRASETGIASPRFKVTSYYPWLDPRWQAIALFQIQSDKQLHSTPNEAYSWVRSLSYLAVHNFVYSIDSNSVRKKSFCVVLSTNIL